MTARRRRSRRSPVSPVVLGLALLAAVVMLPLAVELLRAAGVLVLLALGGAGGYALGRGRAAGPAAARLADAQAAARRALGEAAAAESARTAAVAHAAEVERAARSAIARTVGLRAELGTVRTELVDAQHAAAEAREAAMRAWDAAADVAPRCRFCRAELVEGECPAACDEYPPELARQLADPRSGVRPLIRGGRAP